MSVQHFVAVLLVCLLAIPVPVCAQKPTREQALKATLIEIPSGSVISVKLLSKQKLRGKLGPVTDSGFEVQTLTDGKIETQTLRYDSVKSVSTPHNGMNTAVKITIGVLAGVGVTFLILILAYVHGW